jgi:ketosteroid isomerase-like protein
MNDETTILALIDDISKAHYNKDVAAITAPYAQDAIVCDLSPPLAHQGMDRQSKQAWLDTWKAPLSVRHAISR